MANGKQISKQSVQAFITWIASKTDDDFRAMVSRGVISRREISKECGFGTAAIRQNPGIAKALKALEDQLRARGVLPPLVKRKADEVQRPLMREQGKVREALDADRLRRLEQENASLKAEVSELKRAVEKYARLRDALSTTGRLPR